MGGISPPPQGGRPNAGRIGHTSNGHGMTLTEVRGKAVPLLKRVGAPFTRQDRRGQMAHPPPNRMGADWHTLYPDRMGGADWHTLYPTGWGADWHTLYPTGWGADWHTLTRQGGGQIGTPSTQDRVGEDWQI